MNQQEAAREAQELRQTQAVKKTFDYVISFVAKAGQAGSVSIPINSDGDFHQLGYNIRHSKNSIWEHTVNGSTVQTNFSNLKLKFSSQAANGQQSNDFIPAQLISTPGTDEHARYGTRPFDFTYPENDTLVIEYDNRAPSVLVPGESYTMNDEQVDIVFCGKLYHTK
jgi:hypothetical protein